MITQKRYIDDNEGTGVNEFIDEIIEKHNLRKYFPNVEIRWRLVNYGLNENHPTDDHIVQLVVENRLVALVFMRRDDWNYTEVTCIFIEEALQKCYDFEKRLNEKLKIEHIINKDA